jgi:hypothetical protein
MKIDFDHIDMCDLIEKSRYITSTLHQHAHRSQVYFICGWTVKTVSWYLHMDIVSELYQHTNA